jgi:hypothetical protein
MVGSIVNYRFLIALLCYGAKGPQCDVIRDTFLSENTTKTSVNQAWRVLGSSSNEFVIRYCLLLQMITFSSALYILIKRQQGMALPLPVQAASSRSPAEKAWVRARIWYFVEFVTDNGALGEVLSEYFGFMRQLLHRLLHLLIIQAG